MNIYYGEKGVRYSQVINSKHEEDVEKFQLYLKMKVLCKDCFSIFNY